MDKQTREERQMPQWADSVDTSTDRIKQLEDE